jgi:hypothetical protein
VEEEQIQIDLVVEVEVVRNRVDLAAVEVVAMTLHCSIYEYILYICNWPSTYRKLSWWRHTS